MRQLSIEGAWVDEPRLFPDSRASFHEWFKAEAFAKEVGHELSLAQDQMLLLGRRSANEKLAAFPAGQIAEQLNLIAIKPTLHAPARLIPIARHQPATGVTMLVGEFLNVAQVCKLHAWPR